MSIASATHLGVAIREHRRRAGLTQAQLAARAGISTRTLISLEGGHPGGEVGRVLAVLRALGLTIDLQPVAADDGPDLLDLAGRGL